MSPGPGDSGAIVQFGSQNHVTAASTSASAASAAAASAAAAAAATAGGLRRERAHRKAADERSVERRRLVCQWLAEWESRKNFLTPNLLAVRSGGFGDRDLVFPPTLGKYSKRSRSRGGLCKRAATFPVLPDLSSKYS